MTKNLWLRSREFMWFKSLWEIFQSVLTLRFRFPVVVEKIHTKKSKEVFLDLNCKWTEYFFTHVTSDIFWEGCEEVSRIDLFVSFEPKLRPLCKHLSGVMSSLCLVSLSHFLRRLVLHQTQVSCLFPGLFFWCSPTCLHCQRRFCDVQKDKTALTKKTGTQTNLFNPVNTMPIYSWQTQTFLGVGRNWLAASKCSSWFEFETF